MQVTALKYCLQALGFGVLLEISGVTSSRYPFDAPDRQCGQSVRQWLAVIEEYQFPGTFDHPFHFSDDGILLLWIFSVYG